MDVACIVDMGTMPAEWMEGEEVARLLSASKSLAAQWSQRTTYTLKLGWTSGLLEPEGVPVYREAELEEEGRAQREVDEEGLDDE